MIERREGIKIMESQTCISKEISTKVQVKVTSRKDDEKPRH